MFDEKTAEQEESQDRPWKSARADEQELMQE